MGKQLLRVWGYVREMLPLALLSLGVLLACRGGRRRRLAARGLVSGRSREILLALFVAFCAGLAALTLFPDGFWDLYTHWRYGGQWSGFRTWPEIVERLELLPEVLTPFQEIVRAWRTGLDFLWFMLWGNILMFLPLGFFPALLWRDWKWWKSLLVGFCVSFTIELVQFFIGRYTDIDDVLLNTTGALAGYWLYCLFRRLWPSAARKCHVQEV